MIGLLLMFNLMICVSTLAAVQDQQPSVEKPVERIFYSSYRPAGWDIYLSDTLEGKPKRLTDHPALDYCPTFSADGRWVVFTSERLGNPSLFVIDRENDGPPRLLVRSDAMQDQATVSPDGKWLAFVSTHGGDADVYRLPFRPEVTQGIEEAVNLTKNPGGDFRPVFSPDGRHIAFSSDRDGAVSRHPGIPFALRHEADVYVMADDGSDVRRVTQTPGWDGSPAWAADGKAIYFYSERDESTPYRIFAVTLDGAELEAVTPADTAALAPAVAADGGILFTTWLQQGGEMQWQIRHASADGKLTDVGDSQMDYYDVEMHRATGAMVFHGGPPMTEATISSFPGPLLVAGDPLPYALPDRVVSFAGARHAFTTPPHPMRDEMLFRETPRRIGVAASDGQQPSQLLDLDELPDFPGGSVIHLRYTRDGEWVTFTVGPFAGGLTEPADVWRMRADGTELTNLTPDTPGNDGIAEFSGDGKRFVFRSGRTGSFDIFLADADGTNPRNLTDHPASDTFPAISPLGDQVAFVSDRNGVLDEATGRRTFDVYTLDLAADGAPGNLQQVTSNAAQDAHVGYSPDGAWIIYTSGKNGLADEAPLVREVLFNPQMYGEIYAYRRADGRSVRLTHNKWEDGAPVWTTPVRAKARPTVASALTEIIERDGADAALDRYRTLQADSPAAYRFGEGGLYRLADQYLRDEEGRAAAEVFKLLGMLYPQSVRPSLELGDALMARGDKAGAIAQYRGVITRDPDNVQAAWSLFQAEAEGYEAIDISAEQLEAYVGDYELENNPETLRISVQNGQLHVLPRGIAPHPRNLDDDTLRALKAKEGVAGHAGPLLHQGGPTGCRGDGKRHRERQASGRSSWEVVFTLFDKIDNAVIVWE